MHRQSTGAPAANSSVWEIEEEEASGERAAGPAPSPGRGGGGERDVYVAVGKRSSSMEALSWAIKNTAQCAGVVVYLVHVFPEIRRIPTPLGMLPKDQVSASQVETTMSQERGHRREMLQKFINLCYSAKVDVDTILIESDLIAKAIVDLISVLDIQKLVVGTRKSSMRKLRKANCKAEQIYRSAPEYCDVKIICEGREVKDTEGANSPSEKGIESGKQTLQQHVIRSSVSCNCFASKFI